VARVVVIHRVADVDRWRAAFDAAAELRAAGGELDFEVLHADDDPHLIVHLARWTTIAEARAFFESPEVVAIRKRAGAEPPTFLYLVADPLAAASGAGDRDEDPSLSGPPDAAAPINK
jgi:heme-degrading monooxygenase HmoA